METRWDLVLELSREPFEIEQICQYKMCASMEQSINRVGKYFVTRLDLKL